MQPTVRQARADDYEDVVAFAEKVWADRPETADYIPDVFREWVESDGSAQRTVVVEADGAAAGVCQAVLLTESEAWFQGIRVDPAHRGEGFGLRMVDRLMDWASERGATVGRNMVFSWNDAGLGQSIAAGFDPLAEFRWAHPEPGGSGETPPADLVVESDPAAAWSYWTDSDARTALSGLALDPEQTWALSELTRERLHALADEQAVFTVKGDGTRGMAARVRETVDPTADETLAEYAVGTWTDLDAAAALFEAVRADAADLGVDGTRVLLPETPRHAAEAAAVRASLADWPDFVLSADLT
ncbi:GNAT family N-acetyltransferase [Haloarcula nitratireducens]|uniref:GNAT family N-acetyltransferase n=1 Tax=Haloarcula nitratireducens TaxID=2487749 RepID=A0AAW4PB00_9EURY|nr:GNAT family N-acetyltransferase [Halomicroarcula nitratireducens]MBX0295157.1 GNAT family N-acetyltransferase [Halomicroarcula nitratireducens]